MIVRRAELSELDQIMEIYDSARAFMRSRGNMSQWINGYPSRERITKDIRREQCYVCEQEGQLAGVFAFILGEDRTYQVITEGHWRSDSPYGTVHRLASSGRWPGVSRACFTFCKSRIGHVRADTHAENKVMQRALEANGFVCCGVIHVEDGSSRLAYEYLADEAEPSVQ